MPGRRKFVRTISRGIASALLLPAFDYTDANAHPVMPRFDSNHEENYWREIRSQFPLKKELVFLNCATLGPSPQVVVAAEAATNLELNTNAALPANADALLADIARLVKATKQNIALTHNVTEGINIGVWSIDLQKGDEVIISTHEHVGNALPWLNRARIDGIILKPLKLRNTAEEMFEAVKKSITPKTKVIALPHIPCTNGQVLPIAAICNYARQKGIFTIVDGAHGPGLLQLDLPALGCDIYASCCHKWMLGPKGTGFLYVHTDSIEKLSPQFAGAYSDSGWDLLSSPPRLNGFVPTAHRFFYGTQSPAQYAGVIAAIKFIEAIGQEKIETRTRDLATYLQDQLLDMGKEKIEMLSPTEAISRGASIGFKVHKLGYKEVANACRKEKLIIRAVPENGVDCVRVSTHIFNNKEEIDQLINIIKTLA
ncbi:MAG: aminotransferase class V-fold PLP-dependent enzyme [Bacteroidota bacterium]